MAAFCRAGHIHANMAAAADCPAGAFEILLAGPLAEEPATRHRLVGERSGSERLEAKGSWTPVQDPVLPATTRPADVEPRRPRRRRASAWRYGWRDAVTAVVLVAIAAIVAVLCADLSLTFDSGSAR